jgi:hypothetical protein
MRDQFLQNVEASKQTAANLGERQFADFTPDQQAAFQQTRQFADPNSQQMQQLGTAANMAESAGMYRPQNVRAQGVGASLMRSANIDPAAQFGGASAGPAAQAQAAELNRGDVRNIQGGSVLQQDMGAYMSPYTQAVTQQGLSDLNRSRQIQQQQNAASATAAKAFGGSRQAIAEAETNRAFDENAARFVGQQNASAFQNAQQMAQADLARNMQAQQANQNVDLTTGQLNVQNRQQVGLANQQAANQMAQFNAGNQQQAGLANQQAMNTRALSQAQLQQQGSAANQAAINQASQFNAGNFLQANLANQQAGLQANQQRIGASGLLANVAGQGQQMGFAGANALAQQGGAQQQLSQAQLDAVRNLPLEQQQIINQALGLNVGGGSGMQSSSRGSGSSFSLK